MGLDAHLHQVVGQVLGHLFGERGHQDPLAAVRPRPDLVDEVVHLAFRRPHLHLGVEQAGGADDLLDDLLTVLVLPRAGRGRDVHDLVDMR